MATEAFPTRREIAPSNFVTGASKTRARLFLNASCVAPVHSPIGLRPVADAVTGGEVQFRPLATRTRALGLVEGEASRGAPKPDVRIGRDGQFGTEVPRVLRCTTRHERR